MEINPTGFNNKDLREEIHAISQSIKVLDKKLKNEIESQIPEFLDGLIYRLSKAQKIKELHSDEFIVWDIKEDENIFKPLMESFEENFVYFDDNENAENEKGYLKSILSSDRILILSPKNIDGDSLGSGAMLARLARSLGKEVKIASPIDKIPHKWSFLFPEKVEFISWDRGKKEQALNAILDFKPDMIISPDTSDLDVYRFGNNDTFIDDLFKSLQEQAKLLNKELNIIKLDHHQEGSNDTNFGSFNVVLPTAPSTGAMVLSTILKLNSVTKDFFVQRPWLGKNQLLSLDKRMRDLLAFTLVSDSFGLERVREPRQFFRILNYLKEGSSHLDKEQVLDLEALTSKFQCEDEKSLHLFYKGIDNAKVEERNGWKYLKTFISLDELEELGKPNLQDAELLKSELGHLGDDIDFIILGVEQKARREGEENPIKMTLRQTSNEVADFHAGEIATDSFKGGGHKDTAGWASSENFEEQVEKTLKAIGEKNEGNSFTVNKFALTNKQESILTKLRMLRMNEVPEEFNEAVEKNISDGLSSLAHEIKLAETSDDKKNIEDHAVEVSTAYLSFLLERTTFLQEGVNNDPRILNLMDACLAKGAKYDQASNRLIRNNIKDLQAIKDLFITSNLSHLYFEDKDESKFALSYNMNAIDTNGITDNEKSFINYLRRSTLSTDKNTQLSLLKLTNEQGVIFRLYKNGVKTKDITDADEVEQINDLLVEFNEIKDSDQEELKNRYKQGIFNKLL